jgi:DNA-directed RNA polymerase specialized sigma24 family protein
MNQATRQHEFHTEDEFRAALSLSEAEWAYLRRLARNRCRVSRSGEEEEVLHEAIVRVLEGKRRWPKGVNLFAFLSGVMKSIVSDGPKIGFRRNVDRDIEEAVDVLSEDTSAADVVLETEVVKHVMALFEGDDEAEALAEGILDGWEKEDLLSLFDGDVTHYETVRRRFRRKVTARPELKGMIHGE